MNEPPVWDDPKPLLLAETSSGGRHVVTAHGELDLAGVPALLGLMARVAGRGRVVELDLRGLTFIDSTGVQALEEAVALARDRGAGAVTIRTEPAGIVARVLGLMRTHGRVSLEPDE